MPCLVCGHDKKDNLYEVLLQCSDCGYIWADLNVTDEQLKKLYDRNYFFGEEYADYLKEEKALRKNFSRNLKLLSRYCPSGRMLEIGSAYGFFLDMAREHYEVEGVELNEDACHHAKSQFDLNVACTDFLKQDLPEGQYDIIVMWATIEHLKDPDLYMEKIKRLLKPGAIFACTAPDIGSVLAGIQKEKWRQIHPPTHLNYFSKQTLEKFLNKYGLNVVKTKWLGEYRTVDQALYIILVLRMKMKKLYTMLDKWNLNKGIFYLNTYDQICMVAKKTHD